MTLSFTRRLLKYLRRPTAATDLRSEILYDVQRIRTLQENLTVFPERVRRALHLDTLEIFLYENDRFTQRKADTTAVAGTYAFAASSVVILRLKRESKPAVFRRQRPDGWQLLATAEEVDALDALGTQVLVGLEGRMNLVGFVSLSRRPGEPALNRAEMQFLQQFGIDFGGSLETAILLERLSREAVRRAHITRELELAREVQERLLPQGIPSIAGLEAAASYRSAEQVGGDYYDLFLTASGSLCVVVADVSGHGISSALLMASLRASLHCLLQQAGEDLATAIQHLNRLLYHSSAMNRYATLFALVHRPGSSTLTYVNAGHNPPFLLHPDGSVDQLTVGGTVIGLLAEAEWQQATVPFRDGDVFLAYTDGITETANAAGEEWGEAHLLQVFATAPAGSAESRIAHVLEELQRFTGDVPQADDRTLLVLHRRDASSHD